MNTSIVARCEGYAREEANWTHASNLKERLNAIQGVLKCDLWIVFERISLLVVLGSYSLVVGQ